MSHITLIRHGQANAHAKTETDYDQLSVLGAQQATWLGAHLRDTGQYHNRAYMGTLKRHRDTALAMALGAQPEVDARFNELEYYTLSKAYEAEHGTPAPTEPSQFVHHFPKVLKAWSEDQIEGAPERFGAFEARIRDGFRDVANGQGPAIVVTSGGVIAIAMRLHLGLDIAATANISLAIMNTSIHRFYPVGGTWSPVLFNAVPHLEAPDRHHAQTHV